MLKNVKNHVSFFHMTFIFDEGNYRLQDRLYSIEEIFEIYGAINGFYGIAVTRGFIPKEKVTNPMFDSILKNLNDLGFKIKGLGNSNNTYTLWFNFLLLNLFFITTKELKRLRAIIFDDAGLDRLCDLDNLRHSLFNSLDPYLRLQVQKRGISITHNTYVGFDTEFETVDFKKCVNKLISLQIAAQNRTIIKFPLYKTYDISYINPLTSEITTYFRPDNPKWKEELWKEEEDSSKLIDEMRLINESLKTCIKNIRLTQFPSLDKINFELISLLQNMDGIDVYEDVKKDQLVFSLPLTSMMTEIVYPTRNGYGMKDLINLIRKKSKTVNEFDRIMEILSQTTYTKEFQRLKRWSKKANLKPSSRTTINFTTGDKVSFSLVNNIYLCSHYSAADLPMLSDFSTFMKDLNIVRKSFVTIAKPLKIEGAFLYIRDTILLAPAGSSSLEALGKLYENEGDFKKREIKKGDKVKMSSFLKKDKEAYEEYALMDAVITLKHALALERFNLSIKKQGIPVTLSSLGRNFVLHKWNETFEKYFPYQISGDCLMGNAEEVQTPKGLFSTGSSGLHLSYYIGNYKGGRNESFMYGTDEKTHWFDYDLTSAYTTAMSNLSLPSYKKGVIINLDKIKTLSSEDLLRGYWIFNGSFKFPSNVKYPSIPCFLDKTTTVYPLSGKCLLTGPEYLLALNQKCEFDIKSVFYIPPTEITVKSGPVTITQLVKPFHAIINEVQAKRREYSKNHVMNHLYKEMGNSIYGNVVRGMSDKKSFDCQSGKMFRVTATEISNPILASWTTAFVRSVIGECLHNISKIGGKIVSVTTDGFITDVDDLEFRLLQLKRDEIPLFLLFKGLIEDLNKKSKVLELKNSGVGIISWTTRGQLGIGSSVKATTGFQTKGYTQDELVSEFKNNLKSSEKEFDFIQKRLRGAKEVFTEGGHVTMTMRDQKFRLQFDNRRQILEDKNCSSVDMSSVIYDSEPLLSITECSELRLKSKLSFQKPYLKSSVRKNSSTKYRSFIEVGVRNFIKGYLAEIPFFGLNGSEFRRYSDLITFVHSFGSTSNVRLSKQSVSNLKSRKLFLKPVPCTPENVAFSLYIKSKLSHFNIDSFLNNQM